MKLKDLTGQKFGRLFVIKKISDKGVKHINWMCRCECGVVKSINGDAIKRGLTKSCGCLRKDNGTWNKGKIGASSHMFRGYKNLPRSLFSEIKYKAGKRKIDFYLTITYLWYLYEDIQKGKCAISGIEIEFENQLNINSNLCSLDRIDSSKGYVVGNVQWVDRRINFMKQSMSQQEFIDMCKTISLNNK
jgi:hypothetical protein